MFSEAALVDFTRGSTISPRGYSLFLTSLFHFISLTGNLIHFFLLRLASFISEILFCCLYSLLAFCLISLLLAE